jgi:hypothetical protein
MIYISLTTVPLRMEQTNEFKKNLESLLTQKTDKEYKVLLNIPYKYRNSNKEYYISEELQNFFNLNNNLIVNRLEKDYGPVTKIIGALNFIKNMEDTIIVCDDDHFYHEEMLEYHIKKINEYQNTIICFRGDNPIEKREWNENSVTNYTLSPTHIYFPVKNDSQLIVPGHWHSVSYKRSYFEDDFLDENFLSLSTNDDILVGYYFRLKQIPVMCVKWDKETDWRMVNSNGRGSHSFPILYPLSFPDSGFNEYRKEANNHMGFMDKKVFDEFTENNHKIYIEK